MIVLCPNCHKLFDKGAITIDLKRKKVYHVNSHHPLNNKNITLLHHIDEKYIKYHNDVYGSKI